MDAAMTIRYAMLLSFTLTILLVLVPVLKRKIRPSIVFGFITWALHNAIFYAVLIAKAQGCQIALVVALTPNVINMWSNVIRWQGLFSFLGQIMMLLVFSHHRKEQPPHG